MMAHDEWLAPEPRGLSAATLELLRAAATRAWHGGTAGTTGDDPEVRAAVAAVATEARARQLRAEELVIAFKGVLDDVAEREGPPARGDGRDVQARLVTLCIKAYYEA